MQLINYDMSFKHRFDDDTSQRLNLKLDYGSDCGRVVMKLAMMVTIDDSNDYEDYNYQYNRWRWLGIQLQGS